MNFDDNNDNENHNDNDNDFCFYLFLYLFFGLYKANKIPFILYLLNSELFWPLIYLIFYFCFGLI